MCRPTPVGSRLPASITCGLCCLRCQSHIVLLSFSRLWNDHKSSILFHLLTGLSHYFFPATCKYKFFATSNIYPHNMTQQPNFARWSYYQRKSLLGRPQSAALFLAKTFCRRAICLQQLTFLFMTVFCWCNEHVCKMFYSKSFGSCGGRLYRWTCVWRRKTNIETISNITNNRYA